jgi:hypothetical protein
MKKARDRREEKFCLLMSSEEKLSATRLGKGGEKVKYFKRKKKSRGLII